MIGGCTESELDVRRYFIFLAVAVNRQRDQNYNRNEDDYNRQLDDGHQLPHS